ncbi:MAG: cobalamin biosynthesis protein CobD [Alphaproteobacteria bacterium]|nr:cobalamin biosynthesis protein CobD [Alphaproteobacteria bacterium]
MLIAPELGPDILLLALGALMLDWLIGDPRWLPHPVVGLGHLTGWLDRRLNRVQRSDAERRLRGVLTVLLVVGLAAAVGWVVDDLARRWRWGWPIELALAAMLMAQRSLFDHVLRVEWALRGEGLEAGRAAVALVVGRNPAFLDEHAVARAAIESLAENFSDGVIAPLFWYLLLGPAGICAYKAINTLDSMIGHKTDRYLAFGMVAARLDDVANLIPARLSGLILMLAAIFVPRGKPLAALTTMWRDAAKHRSPNAGWPEAATAGALDLSLAGPRRYHGELVSDPWIGPGRARAEPVDLKRGLTLFALACVLTAALMLLAVGILVQL